MTTPDEIEALFSATIARDFFHMFCGKKLNRGMTRTVYECGINSELVIKFENTYGYFQNVVEWETWKVFKDDKKVARWLAPCIDISGCGMVLLQARTTPPQEKDYPAKLPTFLSDTKRTNYGLLNGKLVCHDYGLPGPIMEASMRLRKADWWDAKES